VSEDTKGHISGKTYDDEMWSFITENFPGLVQNVSTWKHVRTFRGKAIACQFERADKGVLTTVNAFHEYISTVSNFGSLSDPTFVSSSPKYLYAVNVQVFNAMEKHGIGHLAHNMLLFCMPNELTPWLIKKRSDANKIKALFEPLSDNERSRLSAQCKVKFVDGPLDKRHLPSTSYVTDFINAIEYTFEKVVAVDEVNTSFLNSLLYKIMELSLEGETTLHDICKGKPDAPDWIHPSQMPLKRITNYSIAKRHARRLMGIYHKSLKGLRLKDAKEADEEDDEDPEDIDKDAVDAPLLPEVIFKEADPGAFDAQAIASLKWTFNNMNNVQEATVSTWLVDSRKYNDLDDGFEKRTGFLKSGHVGKFKRMDSSADQVCRAIAESITGPEFKHVGEQRTLETFTVEVVKSVGKAIIGNDDIWPIALFSARCLNTKKTPATTLGALHPALRPFDMVEAGTLLKFCEARGFLILAGISEAVAVLAEEAEDMEKLAFFKKFKTETLPGLMKIWGQLKNLEVEVAPSSREAWITLWWHVLTQATEKLDKSPAEVSTNKLQATVQMKVSQMSLKELKDSCGALQCAPGTKEDWAPKASEKEMQKLVHAQEAKSEQWTKVLAEWKTSLKETVKAAHPDALSFAELQAISEALCKEHGTIVSKYAAATSTFDVGCYADITLSLASFLQPLVLKHHSPDVGKYYTKPVAGKSFVVGGKVYVDLKDVGEDSADYVLNLPARIVVCSASNNVSAAVLKSSNKKGFTAGQLDMTHENKMVVVGIPSPAMMQSGDSSTLGWLVRPIKEGEQPVCSTEFTNLSFTPPPYCKTTTIALPVLRIDMKALKKKTEEAACQLVPDMDTDATFVELTRKPFDIEVALQNLLHTAKVAKDLMKSSKRPAEKTPLASKKPRTEGDGDDLDLSQEASQPSMTA